MGPDLADGRETENNDVYDDDVKKEDPSVSQILDNGDATNVLRRTVPRKDSLHLEAIEVTGAQHHNAKVRSLFSLDPYKLVYQERNFYIVQCKFFLKIFPPPYDSM